MGEEIKPAVSRRGLLRRASTVAAGVGVVAAASAAPALAADGDAIQVGGTYTGGAKTSLTSGNSNTPVLKLANDGAISFAPSATGESFDQTIARTAITQALVEGRSSVELPTRPLLPAIRRGR